MTIRMPEETALLVPATHKVQNESQKLLFVGQMTAAGTATSGQLYENIDNDNEQDGLFGKNSMLATMIRAAKYHNKISRIDAIPLADYPHAATTYTQSFLVSTGFTFAAADTEFASSRMQQKDHGAGTYIGDVISVPVHTASTVNAYATFTAVDDGTIRYVIDGQWWNGSAWAASSNTWATSCAATAVTANIATLVPTGANITIKVITNSGSSQMWVSSVVITYYEFASATAAAGSIAFSGTATEAGTITVSVGSKGTLPVLSHVFEVAVTNTETANAIGVALAAAINADTTCPVTAVNTSGSVALTAVNKGTEGNFISLEVLDLPAGITCVQTGMTGGAVNPVLTTLFDVVGDTRYQTVVYPSYVRATAKTFLDARFNVNKKLLDGVGVDCMTDTSANIVSAVSAYNSQSSAVIANKKIATPTAFYTGSGIFEVNTIIAAQFAAIRTLRLTDGANVSQYGSATYGAKDAFGGMHMASKPYFNIPITTLPLEGTGKNFTDTELDALVAAGATVLGNNIAKDSIILGTTQTTYKTDISGNADVSFKYLEYVDTEVTCREYFYTNLRERFAQSRLTDGAVRAGYDVANEEVITSYITGLYMDLANVSLTRIGKDPLTGVDWLTYFKQNLTVTLDLALGKATVYMQLPIVVQLRVINMTIQVNFSANS